MISGVVTAQKNPASSVAFLRSSEGVAIFQGELDKAANDLFKVYDNPSLEKEIREGIEQLPNVDPLQQGLYLHNLILPVADSSSAPEWTKEMRQPLWHFYNLLVETDWKHEGDEPPLGEIANFQQVSPKLYRGSQPTAEGFKWLAGHGVKSVVTLRKEDPLDLDLMEWKDVKHHKISIKDGALPTISQVEEFIRIVDNPKTGPVYVHCRGGIQRTGLMVACWRVSHGWTAQQAVSEARTFATLGTLPAHQEQFVRDFENYWKARYLFPLSRAS